MKLTLPRLATGLFLAWGAVHVLGGLAMMAEAGDPDAYLTMLATGVPSGAFQAPPPDSPAAAVFGFHAWNIFWVGLVVSGIAVTLNRRNSPAGYWVNLALVSGADLGLILFLVLPGVMSVPSALPGLVLWVPAGVVGWMALERLDRGAHLPVDPTTVAR